MDTLLTRAMLHLLGVWQEAKARLEATGEDAGEVNISTALWIIAGVTIAGIIIAAVTALANKYAGRIEGL